MCALVTSRVSISALPGNWLERLVLRPHPRLTESEPAFLKDPTWSLSTWSLRNRALWDLLSIWRLCSPCLIGFGLWFADILHGGGSPCYSNENQQHNFIVDTKPCKLKAGIPLCFTMGNHYLFSVAFLFPNKAYSQVECPISFSFSSSSYVFTFLMINWGSDILYFYPIRTVLLMNLGKPRERDQWTFFWPKVVWAIGAGKTHLSKAFPICTSRCPLSCLLENFSCETTSTIFGKQSGGRDRTGGYFLVGNESPSLITSQLYFTKSKYKFLKSSFGQFSKKHHAVVSPHPLSMLLHAALHHG